MIRLGRAEDELERATRELEEERANRAPERIQRRERIIKLRRQLLELEREEFAEHVHEETGSVLRQMEEFRAQKKDVAPRGEEIYQHLRERLQLIHEASAKDFETLRETIREMGPPNFGPDREERVERLRREMRDLDGRMRSLREELERLGEGGGATAGFGEGGSPHPRGPHDEPPLETRGRHPQP